MCYNSQPLDCVWSLYKKMDAFYCKEFSLSCIVILPHIYTLIIIFHLWMINMTLYRGKIVFDCLYLSYVLLKRIVFCESKLTNVLLLRLKLCMLLWLMFHDQLLRLTQNHTDIKGVFFLSPSQETRLQDVFMI